jgi:hypothetical protein
MFRVCWHYRCSLSVAVIRGRGSETRGQLGARHQGCVLESIKNEMVHMVQGRARAATKDNARWILRWYHPSTGNKYVLATLLPCLRGRGLVKSGTTTIVDCDRVLLRRSDQVRLWHCHCRRQLGESPLHAPLLPERICVSIETVLRRRWECGHGC